MKLTCEGCKHYRGDGHYNSYEYLTYCHNCIRYQAKDNWEPAERTLEEVMEECLGKGKGRGKGTCKDG